MLSSNHLGQPARRRRRKARRGAGTASASTGTTGLREDAARAGPRDPHQPWDAESAEALTRLYESDEGQLHLPHAGERARRDWPRAEADAAAAGATGARDTGWLEAHLSDLAERLQASVVRLDRAEPLAALSRRLETIEERFSTALDRVAQRADMDGLRAIETHVLDLATHLERTRERLEEIGGLEDQVRELAQRLDESDQQQLGVLSKLLRDHVAEWRESEQRTAGALHNLEEAIGRLGDTVDAIEASKPAPDLSLHTLADPEPAGAGRASDPLPGERMGAANAFYSTLDAADYAPRAVPDEPLAAASSEPARSLAGWGPPPSPDAAIQWSAEPADTVHSRLLARDSGSRAARITAVREKLRQARAPADEPPEPDHDPQGPAATRRPGPGLLLLAGVVFLAGGAYLLIQAFTAAPEPAGPPRIERSAQPSRAEPAVTDPAPRPVGRAGAS